MAAANVLSFALQYTGIVLGLEIFGIPPTYFNSNCVRAESSFGLRTKVCPN
jgi:hypothetical protein